MSDCIGKSYSMNSNFILECSHLRINPKFLLEKSVSNYKVKRDPDSSRIDNGRKSYSSNSQHSGAISR